MPAPLRSEIIHIALEWPIHIVGIRMIHIQENGITVEHRKMRMGVYDLDLSANEQYAYVAMHEDGVAQIEIATSKMRMISPDGIATYLRVVPSGELLLVSYQGGGPGGSPGHDALVGYQLNQLPSFKKVFQLPRLPRVGGPILLDPRQDRILLILVPYQNETNCVIVSAWQDHEKSMRN